MAELHDDTVVTVCAECLRACCWQGEFMCDDNQTAGTVDKTVRELRELNARPDFDGEHEDYWAPKEDSDAEVVG